MKYSAEAPLVAVMMPVFNEGETLLVALASLCYQTYSNWKCYIVNDGSTDATAKILKKLSDPRFQIIHLQENRGRAFARQTALEAAEGKYLAFLDADDFYAPQKLERQVQALENQTDLALVSTKIGSFDKERGLQNMSIEKNANKTLIYNYRRELRLAKPATMVILKEAKKQNYDMRLKMAEDTDFIARYLRGKSYKVLHEVLYYYNEYEGNNTQKVLRAYRYKWMRTKKKFRFYPIWTCVALCKILGACIKMGMILKRKGVKEVLQKKGEPAGEKQRREFQKNHQKLIGLIHHKFFMANDL